MVLNGIQQFNCSSVTDSHTNSASWTSGGLPRTFAAKEGRFRAEGGELHPGLESEHRPSYMNALFPGTKELFLSRDSWLRRYNP